MNEDTQIKTGLEAELPSGAIPFALDSDRAVALGRRSRNRRRLAAGGGSVLSAVAIAGLVVAVLTPGAPNGPDLTDGAAADLPPLDPDKAHGWFEDAWRAERTDAAEEYTVAFWDHLEDNYPDAYMTRTVTDNDLDKTERITSDRENTYLAAAQQRLMVVDEATRQPVHPDETPYERTVFTLIQDYTDVFPDWINDSGLSLDFDGDRKGFDQIDVRLVSPGTHTRGSGDAYDLADCAALVDVLIKGEASCEAGEVDDPHAADMEAVTIRRDGDSKPAVLALVHYREDGSAVVVSDRGPGSEGPHLSFEQLAEFATAMPDTPVE